MRYRRITFSLVAVATAVVGAVAVASPASAGLVTSCIGSADNVIVPNDLFVPAGESCELTNVTINGNTTVKAGADLVLNGSHLNGTLTVQSNGFANVVGTQVTGVTKLTSAFGVYTETSTLNTVVVNDSGFFYSLGSSITNITSTNGETYLESVRLAKNLNTTGDVLTDMNNSVVQGTVTVATASQGSVVCLSEIDGNASFSGSGAASGGLIQIGASAPLSGCGFDVFAANVAVTDNVAASYVSDNVIRGTLACTGNAPATVGSSARIRGQISGQCAGPTALAANKATADTAADSRRADILAKVKSRASVGVSAAVKAGHARMATTTVK